MEEKKEEKEDNLEWNGKSIQESGIYTMYV